MPTTNIIFPNCLKVIDDGAFSGVNTTVITLTKNIERALVWFMVHDWKSYKG
ncbi:MAG: hypothetical protein K2P12_02530 [Clostridia bacterium]|nr:hypothetical protein [Clostridia bacterium]